MNRTAANTPEAAVRLTEVGVRLGSRDVLTKVDATFPRGRISAIVGPNGAGKSTLARATVGVIGLETGSIDFFGRDLHSFTPTDLARTVSFVPQDTHVDFSFSVEEVVLMGRYPHLRPLEKERPHDHETVFRVLDTLALGEFAQRDITTLSMGERQRVLLARALATEAPVLVADEPISAFDIGHRLETLGLLRQRASEGLTVIIVLHDLDLALRFADQVLLLDHGRALRNGVPLEVLTSSELERAFEVHVRVVEGGRSLFFEPRSSTEPSITSRSE